MSKGGTAEAVAATARRLAGLGLVSAFGHVSARDHEGIRITSTAPLVAADASSILVVGSDEPPPGAPLEVPLHLAVYRARPDVGAICRTHGPYAVLWGALPRVPPLRHGLGGLSGAVGLHLDPELVCDGERARRAAESLGEAHSLLLAANGSLSVGADLAEALARAWYFEDRCRVAWEVGRVGPRLDTSERGAHYPAELARAAAWANTLDEGKRETK